MCFDYDDVAVEFYEERIVTARKPHKCYECRAMIDAGEKYHYHSAKSDGRFYVVKICRRCCYDRVRVVEHELAEGCRWHEAWPPFGELTDHLSESGMGQTRIEDVPATFQVGDQPREVAQS